LLSKWREVDVGVCFLLSILFFTIFDSESAIQILQIGFTDSESL